MKIWSELIVNDKYLDLKIYSTNMVKCYLNDDFKFKFPLEEIKNFKEDTCFNK